MILAVRAENCSWWVEVYRHGSVVFTTEKYSSRAQALHVAFTYCEVLQLEGRIVGRM